MKISIDKQKSFVDYFISKVYVLPIVLKDDDLDVARSNALMVFETINDRGMDLQDADIFKAKLYQMSLTIGKGDEFIRKWKEINSRCEDLNIKIDDLFRYYYHIIRGREGIIVAEKRLREFFQKDNKSPFKKGDYGYVLSSLLDTLDAIEINLMSHHVWRRGFKFWMHIQTKIPFTLLLFIFIITRLRLMKN